MAFLNSSECECVHAMSADRTVAMTLQMHVTKDFRVAKERCVQWQLNGSCCCTHAIGSGLVESI